MRVLQYPLPGFFQQFERGHEFIDNPDLQGLLRLEQCSFKQQWQGFLDPDQAWQTLGPAASRKQPDSHFRKTHRGFGVVGQYSMMAGQCQL
ncbi:hypothetical protein D3C72_2382820 [compost metagenome]